MSSTTRKTTQTIPGKGLFGSATIDMHCCILTINIVLISIYQHADRKHDDGARLQHIHAPLFGRVQVETFQRA